MSAGPRLAVCAALTFAVLRRVAAAATCRPRTCGSRTRPCRSDAPMCRGGGSATAARANETRACVRLPQFGVYGFLQDRAAPFIEYAVSFNRRPNRGCLRAPSRLFALPARGEQKLRNFVCGAIAGCMSTTFTYPFDVMRTQFAVQGAAKVRSDVDLDESSGN